MEKKRADHLSLSDKVIYPTAWGPVVCRVVSLSLQKAYEVQIMVSLESEVEPIARFTFFVPPGEEIEMAE